MATVSRNNLVARNVEAKRLADTPENRAKLAADASKDRLPSAVVDLGADVMLLSGAELRTQSRIGDLGKPALKAKDTLSVDGTEGTILSTDDGFSEIDASKVVVAVLDTGIDMDHPAFKDRIVSPYDATGGNDLTDQIGHGTHVAGIAAGAWGIKKDAGGVAPTAKIMPVKVFGKDGKAEPAVIAKGIRYAVDNGAKVINMSLGATRAQLEKQDLWKQMPELEAAIAYAREHNVLVVVSSGNDGKDDISEYFPASYPGVLTVGAVNSSHKRTSFSNGGDELEVTAPGAQILSAYPGKGASYKRLDGTSMASPYAAGAAALVMAQHPDWTVEQVKSHLERAVEDRGAPGKDIGYGYGEIDLFKAAYGKNLPAVPVKTDEPAESKGVWDRIKAFFG